VRLLERLGVQCELPEGQTCCGQPFYNSGFQSQTIEPARQWLRVFGRTADIELTVTIGVHGPKALHVWAVET